MLKDIIVQTSRTSFNVLFEMRTKTGGAFYSIAHIADTLRINTYTYARTYVRNLLLRMYIPIIAAPCYGAYEETLLCVDVGYPHQMSESYEHDSPANWQPVVSFESRENERESLPVSLSFSLSFLFSATRCPLVGAHPYSSSVCRSFSHRVQAPAPRMWPIYRNGCKLRTHSRNWWGCSPSRERSRR